MTDLTDDEFTVLMIASHGESMASIGRWRGSIESLVVRGFLERRDEFNNFITVAGRQALLTHEKVVDNALDESLGRIVERSSQLGTSQKRVRMSAEQAVEHLVSAARETARTMGHSPEHAAKEWSKVILDAALEKLRG